jgi:hypothetical protein
MPSQLAESRQVSVLEQGRITFFYRPRVEQQRPEELGDVQRMLMLLEPEGRDRYRLIALGRKQLPQRGRHERFWGFVDVVLDHPQDMEAVLAAQTYGTKSRGVRHLPAARLAGEGTYALEEHDDHTHLAYSLDTITKDDPVVSELMIEESASYIVAVANPDPTAWGLVDVPPLQQELFDELEVHVTIPSPFPAALQERFRGRRYAQLDEVEWLEHPGGELIFIGE